MSKVLQHGKDAALTVTKYKLSGLHNMQPFASNFICVLKLDLKLGRTESLGVVCLPMLQLHVQYDIYGVACPDSTTQRPRLTLSVVSAAAWLKAAVTGTQESAGEQYIMAVLPCLSV